MSSPRDKIAGLVQQAARGHIGSGLPTHCEHCGRKLSRGYMRLRGAAVCFEEGCREWLKEREEEAS